MNRSFYHMSLGLHPRFSCTIILVLLSITMMAQNCIQGMVFNSETGLPVSGANITASGYRGTTTDQNGNFSICSLPFDSIDLKISFLGFESLLIKALPDRSGSQRLKFGISPKPVLMDELVITATRTDNLVNQTPVRVNLLSSRFIQNAPSQTVDEVLKFVPGMNWSRPFGIFSTKATVTMRGMSGKEQGRVMVLLDGVPLNKSDGGTVDWNMIDMDLIRKIEVTKGAGSALYGGTAMGGIIHIMTDQPAERFRAKASIEYGTYNTAGARLTAGGRKSLQKPQTYMFWNSQAFFRKSDGYITQSEADVLSNPYIVKSNLMELGVNLKGGCQLGEKHSVDAMLNYYNDHRGTGEKVFLEDGNVTDHDSYGITLHYKGHLGKVRVNSSVYSLTENYKKVNEYKKDDYTWYDVLSVRNDHGLMTNFTRDIGKKHLLTLGFDYRNGSVDAYDKYFTSTDIVYNEGKMRLSALFIQDELTFLGDRLRIIAGLRYDRATFFDGSFRIEQPSVETSFMMNQQVPEMPVQHWGAWSPRISAQYRFSDKLRIYTMLSRGFRASVLDDLCRSGRIKGGFKLANPGLQPEYLTNVESGFDVKVSSSLVWSASGYYSRGKDFQYYVWNGQTIDMGFGDRPVFVRANISEVEIAGIEAEIKWEASSYLTLFANYGFSQSVILNYKRISENDTIDLSGKKFTDVPEHVLSAGLNWSNRILNTSILYRYNGAMYINDRNTLDEILLMTRYPSYSTVDLKIWKQLMESLKVSLSVQNLFDVKYYDSKYAVCPGRFVTALVTYQF